MSWQENNDYKKRRAELERVHAIGSKLLAEHPDLYANRNEAIDVAEIVQLEMEFASGNHGVAVSAGNLAYKWLREKNSYYMDLALMLCARSGVSPSPTLLALIGDAASRRFAAGHSGLKGTSASIQRDHENNCTLLLVANLVYHGEHLHTAASKAARWRIDRDMKEMKASTIEKYYVDDFRNPGTEASYFSSWDRSIDAFTREEWRQIIAHLPETLEHQKGSRR